MVQEPSKGGCLTDPEMTGIWIYRWIFGVKFSGTGTNMKVGGTGPVQKWGGHQNILLLVVPLHFFGSKSTISCFGERFRDGQ